MWQSQQSSSCQSGNNQLCARVKRIYLWRITKCLPAPLLENHSLHESKKQMNDSLFLTAFGVVEHLKRWASDSMAWPGCASSNTSGFEELVVNDFGFFRLVLMMICRKQRPLSSTFALWFAIHGAMNYWVMFTEDCAVCGSRTDGSAHCLQK